MRIRCAVPALISAIVLALIAGLGLQAPASAAVDARLTVAILGLPKTVAAKVSVTGPKQTAGAKTGFSRSLRTTTTLTGLLPGTYSATASPITVPTGTWIPTPLSTIAKVARTASPARTTITYRFIRQPAGKPRWSSTPSSNPLTAQLTADASRAATKDFTTSGGTLTAKGADGVTYTLSIPGNALLEPTSITMTPLSTLRVAPSTAKGYGVQLQPDGLNFQNFATLRITPPAGTTWPVKDQLPISVDGTTRRVSLPAIDTRSANPLLRILHFSDHGVLWRSKGSTSWIDTDSAAYRDRLGGNAEERIQSAVGEMLSKQRQLELLGETYDKSAFDIIDTLMVSAYVSSVLVPRLNAAETGCATGKLAIRTLFGLERQVQLLGFDRIVPDFAHAVFVTPSNPRGTYSSSTLAGMWTLVDKVAVVCAKEDYENCRDDHIIVRTVPAILGYVRQSQLLGVSDPESTPTFKKINEYGRKCLQFEVRMDGTSEATTTQPSATERESVSSTIKLGWNYDTLSVESKDSAAISSNNYTADLTDPCARLTSTTGRNSTWSDASLVFSLAKPGARVPVGSQRATFFSLGSTVSAAKAGRSTHEYVSYPSDGNGGCKSSGTLTGIVSSSFTKTNSAYNVGGSLNLAFDRATRTRDGWTFASKSEVNGQEVEGLLRDLGSTGSASQSRDETSGSRACIASDSVDSLGNPVVVWGTLSTRTSWHASWTGAASFGIGQNAWNMVVLGSPDTIEVTRTAITDCPDYAGSFTTTEPATFLVGGTGGTVSWSSDGLAATLRDFRGTSVGSLAVNLPTGTPGSSSNGWLSSVAEPLMAQGRTYGGPSWDPGGPFGCDNWTALGSGLTNQATMATCELKPTGSAAGVTRKGSVHLTLVHTPIA